MEGELKIRERIILVTLVLLLITGAAWRMIQVNQIPDPEIIQVDNSANDQLPTEEVEEELIIVHLAGEVKSPGIYQLPEGSRVYELLELGGGFTDNADRETINLARPLLDGEQIFVYLVGEGPKLSAGSSSNLININRASASELTALPGIGEVRAAQIVNYRERHGLFKTKEEIMDVSGIGQTTFDNFSDMITVY